MMPGGRRSFGRATLAAAVLVAAIGCGGGSRSAPSAPPASPTAPTPSPTPTPPPPLSAPRARLLVVTHTTGFRHSSIPIAETVIQGVGTDTGLFDTEFCRTGDDVVRLLTRDGLARYDAVFFANTTGNLGIPNVGDLVDWVAAGHAFLGAHSASDTYHDDPRYLAMLGGEFLTHGDQAEADVRVDAPSDPAVAHLAPRFRIFDEIYKFTRNNRAEVEMLLSLDRHPPDGSPEAGQPGDLPIAWHKSLGAGRVFYTALGHREDVWTDPRFRQHLAGAIRWALGR